jgi:hypothetical protein
MQFAFCGLLLLAVTPVWAHHSFAAEYDRKQVIKLTGVVTRVDWSNPHVYFYIDVKDPETGRVTNGPSRWLPPPHSRRAGGSAPA